MDAGTGPGAAAPKSGGFRVLAAAGLVVVLAAVSIVWVLVPRTAETPGVFRDGVSLTAAIAEARESDRVVVAVATADWCGPCQAYKRGALADGGVQSWLEANSVPVMVDVTHEPPADAAFLEIGPIPTTYVIDGEGRVLARLVGNTGAGEVLSFLREHAPEAISVPEEETSLGEG